MSGRRDALAAAAEMVLAVERRCRRGARRWSARWAQIEVRHGAVNVIPGTARFTVDVRSANDDVRLERGRRDAAAELPRRSPRGAARARPSEESYAAAAAPCDAGLQDADRAQRRRAGMAAALAAQRRRPRRHGHGRHRRHRACCSCAAATAASATIPDEMITAEDAEIATAVLLHFLEHFQAP